MSKPYANLLPNEQLVGKIVFCIDMAGCHKPRGKYIVTGGNRYEAQAEP